MSLLDNASIVWPLGAQTKAGNLAAWNPQTKSTVPFDVVRATIKQRINEASAWEEVAANVLARDFTNGGCGDFTIEPARKFLFLNSTTGVTQDITVVSGVDYAVSFSGTGSITFSVGATGTLTGSGATALDRVSSIVTTTGTSVTCTVSGTVQYVNIEINTNDSSVTYPTSWMKTLGSIVTRNADVPSLTGASALLGQAEGGFYLEALWFEGGNRFNGIELFTDSNNRIGIFKDLNDEIEFGVKASGVTVFPTTAFSSNYDFHKYALGYVSGNNAGYVDGNALVSNTTSITLAGTLDKVNFDLVETPIYRFTGRIRQFVVFNQRPTNSQLAAISTP
jgi:hypothetical protein